jgi:hypothetical protein
MISFLKSILVCIFFADVLERRFPQEFKAFLTVISFNTLYFYSKLQIYFFKFNNKINNYIKSNPNLLKIKNELEILMKPCDNSNLMEMTQFFKDGKILMDENDKKNIDFAVYSWLCDDKKYFNKKIIYDINEPITKADCSDIKFILIEIKAGEKIHKIDLKRDDYNFYLVGNKFTKKFFMYYLVNYLNINELEINKTNFSIKIIDHNVETFQMNFTDKNESITLRKNDYIPQLNNSNN